MQDALLVKVLQAEQHAGNEEFGLLFVELAISGKMVAEIAAAHHVYNEVQVLPVVEGVVHVDEKRVVKLAQELLLVNDGVHAPLGHHARL